MKHNNIICNIHFRKDWQRYVKTWLDQPAKKAARKAVRAEKAQKAAPRPVGLLRPVVRCPTNKYNNKVRAGRGFTLDELKAAGVSPLQARSIGISVDHRRKNRSQEQFKQNVQRLQAYKAKLVILDKKGEKPAFPGAEAVVEEVAKKIYVAEEVTKALTGTSAFGTLRKARNDARKAGRREKRAEIAAVILEERANKKSKKSKKSKK
ncbi:MAG: hypothetical protein MHM6MM_003427 [Cercozoa sp. M6MM]